MKNKFAKFGTLLTREESKKVNGGVVGGTGTGTIGGGANDPSCPEGQSRCYCGLPPNQEDMGCVCYIWECWALCPSSKYA